MQGIATHQIAKDNLKLNQGDLSGDLISGGTITKFQSTGITDLAKKRILILEDSRLIIDAGLTVFNDERKPIFEVDNNSIRFYKPIISDVKIENKVTHSPNIELTFDNANGSGLIAKDNFNTQYILYKDNNWEISDSLKIKQNKNIQIGKRMVLNELELGPTVVSSNLKKVGVLKELRVDGDFIVADSLYYNPATTRLGINTLDPHGILGMIDNGVEFVMSGEEYLRGKIGLVTKHDLHLVTNNKTGIKLDREGNVIIGDGVKNNSKVSINHSNNSDFALSLNNNGMGLLISSGKEGKLVIKDQVTNNITLIVNDSKVGINVSNPEANLHVAGDVNLMGKHMFSAGAPPTTGTHHMGDIVWNSNPGPTKPIGWVCVQDGVPGIWAVFGRIESV